MPRTGIDRRFLTQCRPRQWQFVGSWLRPLSIIATNGLHGDRDARLYYSGNLASRSASAKMARRSGVVMLPATRLLIVKLG